MNHIRLFKIILKNNSNGSEFTHYFLPLEASTTSEKIRDVINIENYELISLDEVSVRTVNPLDLPCVRISDIAEIDNDLAVKFRTFMRGQTMPYIEGEDIQDFCYIWDFTSFFIGGIWD